MPRNVRQKMARREANGRKERALAAMAEGKHRRPNFVIFSNHEPDPEQNRRDIEAKGIKVGTVIVEHGETIPRRVADIDGQYRLVLMGCMQRVLPSKVSVRA